MEALGKLIDAIVGSIERLTPWVIVNEGQGGVVLRLGRYARTLRTGYNWKWPLIELGVTIDTALTTLTVGPQSLTAADGRAFVVSAVLKYRVRDPKPLCCDISDEVEALSDVTSAAIKHALTVNTWAEITRLNGDLELSALSELKKANSRRSGTG